MKVTIASALIAFVIGGFLIGKGLDDRSHVRCGTSIMKTSQQCKVDGETRTFAEQREATAGDWKVNVIVGSGVIVFGAGRGIWTIARSRRRREPEVPSVR